MSAIPTDIIEQLAAARVAQGETTSAPKPKRQKRRAKAAKPSTAPHPPAAAIKSGDADIHYQTDEFETHHDTVRRARSDDDRRPARRVFTRLERLASDDRSPDAGRLKLLAGERFHDDWAVGVCGVRQRSGVQVDGGSTAGGPNDAQLNALARFHIASAAVGEAFALLLVMCCCEDRSWVKIGSRCGVSDKTAREWTDAALSSLAQHYHDADHARSRKR